METVNITIIPEPYPVDETTLVSDHQSYSEKQHICCVCDKQFARRQGVVEHLRNVHKIEPGSNLKSRQIRCTFDSCHVSFTSSEKLRLHLRSIHNFRIQCENHKFTSYEEFFQWKKEEERRSASKFVAQSGVKKLSNGTWKQHFMCHRSGVFKSHSTGRRSSQRSCKIGKLCPAQMSVEKKNDQVFVRYFKTHHGHEPEIPNATPEDNTDSDNGVKTASPEVIQVIIEDENEQLIAENAVELSASQASNNEVNEKGSDPLMAQVKSKLSMLMDVLNHQRPNDETLCLISENIDRCIQLANPS